MAAPGAAAPASHTADFFPMAVWYGGGKARAPMLETDAAFEEGNLAQGYAPDQERSASTPSAAWIDWATGEPREKQYHFDTST